MKKQILNEEFHRMQQLAGIKPLYEAYTGPKSKLEKIIQQAWGESDINAAKKLVIDFISPSKIKSKDQIINTIKGLTNKREFDRYMANALLKFEKLGLSEEQVNENNLSEAWDWDINEFGEYNSSTKTFEIFMDGDGFSDYMDTEFPGWLEDEDITDEGREKFIEDIKNAVKEKYGPGVKIEGEGFSY